MLAATPTGRLDHERKQLRRPRPLHRADGGVLALDGLTRSGPWSARTLFQAARRDRAVRDSTTVIGDWDRATFGADRATHQGGPAEYANWTGVHRPACSTRATLIRRPPPTATLLLITAGSDGRPPTQALGPADRQLDRAEATAGRADVGPRTSAQAASCRADGVPPGGGAEPR